MSSSEPVCITDLEKEAKQNISKRTLGYFEGGADEQLTLKDNIDAFTRLKLRPRMLRGVSEVDMSTTLLGQTVAMPICVAPVAYQKLAHPDGELATAKVCGTAKTCMTLSMASTSTLEDVAFVAPSCLLWFQIYVFKDEEIMKDLIGRAERAGYKALVLTVDAPIFGNHVSSIKVGLTIPPGMTSVHCGKDGRGTWSEKELDVALTWEIIGRIKSISKLPVVVKGILTAGDAKLAIQHGADAIVVSNHGGRQLDGVLATIDALPEVVSAVNGQIEVYMDGGVRLGTDVLKALALGARAVFIGRPVIWGLAYQGEEGVRKVLEMLRDELRAAMILSGCSTLADISPFLVTRRCKSYL